MTQERDSSDGESERVSKIATDQGTASVSPGRRSKKIKIEHGKEDSLDRKEKIIRKWTKNGPRSRPGFGADQGVLISREAFYRDYYCDKRSSITFTINGIPQSVKQTSILDAPFIDPGAKLPNCTTADTPTCPDHTSVVGDK